MNFEHSLSEFRRDMERGVRFRDLDSGYVWYMVGGTLYREKNGTLETAPDGLLYFLRSDAVVHDNTRYPMDFRQAMKALADGKTVERRGRPGHPLILKDGRIVDVTSSNPSMEEVLFEADFRDDWRVVR